MDKVKEYLTNPGTWISFIVFVFGLGAGYATLNNRIANLEKQFGEINMVEIQSTLSQIQTDISWIKLNLTK